MSSASRHGRHDLPSPVRSLGYFSPSCLGWLGHCHLMECSRRYAPGREPKSIARGRDLKSRAFKRCLLRLVLHPPGGRRRRASAGDGKCDRLAKETASPGYHSEGHLRVAAPWRRWREAALVGATPRRLTNGRCISGTATHTHSLFHCASGSAPAPAPAHRPYFAFCLVSSVVRQVVALDARPQPVS